jgi:hypothetical protein
MNKLSLDFMSNLIKLIELPGTNTSPKELINPAAISTIALLGEQDDGQPVIRVHFLDGRNSLYMGGRAQAVLDALSQGAISSAAVIVG